MAAADNTSRIRGLEKAKKTSLLYSTTTTAFTWHLTCLHHTRGTATSLQQQFTHTKQMCWNLPVSLAAAVYGLGMSYYFAFIRKHSYRDPWYGLFLTSFTLTQLMDAFFWYSSRTSLDGEVPCDATNKYFTKIIVSAAIFSQVRAILDILILAHAL